jgi:hypothetical protein
MNVIARVSNYKGTQPLLGKFMISTGLFTGAMTIYSFIQSKLVESELEYRKSQLSKPIVRLST